MTTFLTLLKIEGKLVWKGIDILIFGICFPIILATVFGYLLSKDGPIRKVVFFRGVVIEKKTSHYLGCNRYCYLY